LQDLSQNYLILPYMLYVLPEFAHCPKMTMCVEKSVLWLSSDLLWVGLSDV